MNVTWPRLLTPTHLIQLIRKQKNPLSALQLFNEAKPRYPNYRHNGPVYATMIQILGSSGRVTQMRELIDQMKEDSCECRDSVFAGAIKIYAEAGLLDEATSLFRNLSKFNCVNWTESFNTLLQIMVRESKLDTVHRLFLESSYGWEVKSRTRSLNLLIDALCHNNRSDLALEIFQEMNYQCCHPDRETYRILMRGLCEEGRLNEATHLLYSMFWKISQKGSGEDVVIYRILLDALCDNGHVEEALDILSKILRKGMKSPKRCHKQLDLYPCQNGVDVQRAKVMINEALIKGMVPSLDSYSAMAIGFYSESKIDEANKVLDEMNNRGFRPSLFTYEAKIAALCRESRVDEAMKVIEGEMVESDCVPNVRLHNIVIKGLCDIRKSNLAVGYLEKMARKAGCVPNKETYATIVDGLCCDGRFAEASRISNEMVNREYWPRVETLSALICGLCSSGRQYEAFMWLEEMVSEGKAPEFCIWDSLVSSVCPFVFSEVLEQITRYS